MIIPSLQTQSRELFAEFAASYFKNLVEKIIILLRVKLPQNRYKMCFMATHGMNTFRRKKYNMMR